MIDWASLGRCPICPGANRCVSGDGPMHANVMCIGEEPGREEDAGGRPFIGQAGQEFNQNYLPLAGLTRNIYNDDYTDVYITNTRKCRQHQNKTPTYAEAIGCADHFIPHELRVLDPSVVILMGSTACKLLGERAIDLEAEHGIPRWGTLYGWEGWIVPINHPAAGLHDGAMMTPMLEDWEALGPWLRDGKWMWVDETEHTVTRDYRLCRTPEQIDRYFTDQGMDPLLFPGIESYLGHLPWLGVDTETHARVRWSIQVSCKVGTGMMIQTDNGTFDPELLDATRYWIRNFEWAMHNAEADLWVADLLDLPNHPYRDTMQEAYQFQNLSQKLKVLARRKLGRKRPSWEELVTPYSRNVLHDWLGSAVLFANENWQVVTPRFHKKTNKPLKPKVDKHVAEKLLLEIDGYMVGNPDYPVWDKLKERVPTDVMEQVVGVLGPTPQKGIAHVPLDEAVHYACSDADDTLALALLFDTMRPEFKDKLNVREEDRDDII